MSRISKLNGTDKFSDIISTINTIVDEVTSMNSTLKMMATNTEELMADTEKFTEENATVSEEQMASYLKELYPEEVGE